MIPAKVPFTSSGAPPKYSPDWMASQLAAIARAIPVANVRTVKAATTITVNDDLILADGTSAGFTVTLLPASQVQFLKVTIKKTDVSAHAITIGGTVDGTASPTLATQYKSMTIQSDGTSWNKIASI